MITLYGIKNCDTVKKARAWLDAHGIEYRFHDFRADGLDEKRLRAWVKELGWETLLNRRGTTWRRLPEKVREGIDEIGAIKVMLAEPAIIKRPVLDLGKERRVGFTPEDYASDLL
jgi:arsenate reductase (glutaredoxin)